MTQNRARTEKRDKVWRVRLLATFVLLGLVLTPQANGHDGATGVVKERMEIMSALGKTMKTLRAFANGEKAIDAATLSQSAETIRRHSDRMPKLFPAGTYDPPSEALPAIDESRAEFDGLAARLGEQAGSLGTLAGSANRDGLKKWYRDTGRVCSACHKQFREKR